MHGAAKRRRWRDLGVWGTPVWLAGEIARVKCRKCGIRTMAVPWARVGSRFTRRFEDEVAWFLQHSDQTATAEYFGISWETAGRIARRVVAEKIGSDMRSALRRIAVDEICYGRPRKFLTVVTDHDTGRVVWGADGASSEALAAFFRLLGPEGAANIELVTMDMDAAYEKAVREHLPNAVIVYDKFHVMQLLSVAIDQERREQMRNSSREARQAIKGTRWPLLRASWNLTLSDHQKIHELQRTNRPLYRSRLLRDSFELVYLSRTAEEADQRFAAWYSWARRSMIAPIKRAATTIRDRWDGVRRYFTTGLTNARAEGNNSKVRMISHRAFGFHSARSLVAMIQLNCSGITLLPIGHRRPVSQVHLH